MAPHQHELRALYCLPTGARCGTTSCRLVGCYLDTPAIVGILQRTYDLRLVLSKVSASGTSTGDDGDVWCLDSRGILTLAVGKQTYETLGIAGERLPCKECSDTHGKQINV